MDVYFSNLEMTWARESIDSPRAKNDRLRTRRDKWQLVASVFSWEKGNLENQTLSKKIVWARWIIVDFENHTITRCIAVPFLDKVARDQ